MTSLRATIEADFLKAYRASEKQTVEVLRLLKAVLLNAEIEKRAKTGEREVSLTDEEAMAVVKRQVKGLEESLELYRQGKRDDLVSQTEGEVVIMKRYLPEELSEEAVRAAVRSAVDALGTPGPQDFGKVMGEAMKALKGKASGDVVSKVVKEFLHKE
ncbi:MAG: GatB/YqeY domain-containing protein [Patescibacteria group bacterium]